MIAALLVGAVAQWYVITISRQYGSGGHAVGERIARKLGITFYDSKLIDPTAIASGFTPGYVENHEQKLSNGLLNKLYDQNYAYMIIKAAEARIS
ncbi:MAG: cytidylate kinase family protein [Proteiniphilum sp.]